MFFFVVYVPVRGKILKLISQFPEFFCISYLRFYFYQSKMAIVIELLQFFILISTKYDKYYDIFLNFPSTVKRPRIAKIKNIAFANILVFHQKSPNLLCMEPLNFENSIIIFY
jgi:hypothetical protein